MVHPRTSQTTWEKRIEMEFEQVLTIAEIAADFNLLELILAKQPYISGIKPTSDDAECFAAICRVPFERSYPKASYWYGRVSLFSEEERDAWPLGPGVFNHPDSYDSIESITTAGHSNVDETDEVASYVMVIDEDEELVGLERLFS